jgi:hypothetical protein
MPLAGDGDGEPGLAGSARPDERENGVTIEQVGDLGQFLVTAPQRVVEARQRSLRHLQRPTSGLNAIGRLDRFVVDLDD